jgi:hypothetical protein
MFMPGIPFVRGVNGPWLSYGNDFGASAWHPHGGLSRLEQRAALDRVFEALSASGAQVVRWFVLCDGRAGLHETRDGGMDGIDARLVQDLDLLIRAAEASGVALVLVLLDFHWCHPEREVNGVRCGGRAPHLTDPALRRRFLDRVLQPILSRYAGVPAIAAWDLINEPEWVTFSWNTWRAGSAVLPDSMCDYIAEAAALVHACTDHVATVGLATAASLPRMRGLGLDVYQAHWYDTVEAAAPLARPVSAWVTDAPVLLGEFPTRESRLNPAAIEAVARQAGYCGALAWSLLATDDSTDPDRAREWLEGPQPVVAKG